MAVTVHRWSAAVDGRPRIWSPTHAAGSSSDEAPGKPLLETMPFDNLILVVDLQSSDKNPGVLSTSSSRALDRAGWRLEGGVTTLGGAISVDIQALFDEMAEAIPALHWKGLMIPMPREPRLSSLP